MYLLISVGSIIGAYAPVILFHVDPLGLLSVLGGVVGSIAGIFVAYRLSE